MSASASSIPTPTKASPGKKQHFDTIKVPCSEKTGNETIDSDAQAKHKLLIELTNHLISDRSLVLPLYNKLQDILKDRTEVQEHEAGSFGKISTVGRTAPEFSLSYLAGVSDLTVQDLLQIKKIDEDGPIQLLTFDTQLNDKLRLPPACAVEEFWGHFLKQRSNECGSRLRNFKSSGGITPSFGINWAKGSYKLTFNPAGVLTKVLHCATATSIDIDASYGLGTTWVLINNWSDWDAALVKPPMAAVKLNQFFKGIGSGPHTVRNFGCKHTEFAKAIDVAFQLWDTERQQNKATAAADISIATDGLGEIKQQKAQENLKRARDKAQATLRNKRAKAETRFPKPTK